MIEWAHWLRDAAAAGPAAMVSVLATEGSAPRGAGTRMIVIADALYGTIGGGQLEYRAVEQARAILSEPAGAWRVQDYPLGPLLGQCCGGRVRLLVDHVDPAGLGWTGDATEGRFLVTTLSADGVQRHVARDAAAIAVPARGDRPRAGSSFTEIIGWYRRPLYLFGAGHVGQAIARHAAPLPFRLAWFDTRPVFETVPGVAIVPEDAIGQCVAEAPDDAAIVILTHDHALDYRLTRAALARVQAGAPLAFVGLIGSATKRARFAARLGRDGVDGGDRLTCPIGIAGIGGKEPDVIAVATLAQLLQLDRA